ncbi:hypothetical protein [Virgisporangium ochraceum]|uniref:Uncharacterized protein n=1 Tax=Virgisporangium ochraceum TaxID=65505 RepID=A0A8J4EC71_9ACTN|nr:hypothetical protein [Virgisporangium ochraceum]GIJ69401.1 hypothetical protein Voc01_043180 [Virgisporangium ochraceum]
MTDEPASRVGTTAKIGKGPLVVAAVSVAWFVAALWLTHASVVGEREPQLGLVNASLAMPLLIASGIVAGAALAVVVVGWLTLRGTLVRPRWQVLAGAGAGLALGAVAGALVLLGYGTVAALVSLSIAMALAAAVGGAIGGVPWPAVVVAGVIGSLVRFALGFLEGLFGGRLREAIVRDDSVAAQLAAVGQIGFAMALLGGAVAGLTASLYLRRSGLKWPAHLAAGAAPGLLLLIAEVATRLGGTPLLSAMSGNDTFDERATQLVADTRLSTALVVLFTGAVVAIIVHGRTLSSAPPPPARTTARTAAGKTAASKTASKTASKVAAAKATGKAAATKTATAETAAAETASRAAAAKATGKAAAADNTAGDVPAGEAGAEARGEVRATPGRARKGRTTPARGPQRRRR